MRPTTTTTVATYGILMMAGAAPLALPDSLSPPVVSIAHSINDVPVTDITVDANGMWSRPAARSAASFGTSSPLSFD